MKKKLIAVSAIAILAVAVAVLFTPYTVYSASFSLQNSSLAPLLQAVQAVSQGSGSGSFSVSNLTIEWNDTNLAVVQLYNASITMSYEYVQSSVQLHITASVDRLMIESTNSTSFSKSHIKF